MRFFASFLVALAALAIAPVAGQEPKSRTVTWIDYGQALPYPKVADQFDALHFRSIGPAVMSGRVSDIAVYEANPSIFYVATAHSGLWKTTNGGTTFTPQFQDKGYIS